MRLIMADRGIGHEVEVQDTTQAVANIARVLDWTEEAVYDYLANDLVIRTPGFCYWRKPGPAAESPLLNP